MAISFPMPLADFFGGLRIVSAQFHVPEVLEMSRTGAGEVLTADLGTRLWGGSVALVPGYHADIEAIEAKLSILRQAGRSFFVSPATKAFPKDDPTGSKLGTATPTIDALTNSRELKLAGLPAAYVISPGDFVSFVYAGKYALHQVVTGGVAAGSGKTGNIEVTPHIRPGAVVGASVQLVRPHCKAVYVPGSHQAPTNSPLFASGSGFSFIQTLK